MRTDSFQCFLRATEPRVTTTRGSINSTVRRSRRNFPVRSCWVCGWFPKGFEDVKRRACDENFWRELGQSKPVRPGSRFFPIDRR